MDFVVDPPPLSQIRSSLPNFIHCFDQIEKEIDDLLVKDMTSFPMEFHRFAVGVFDLSDQQPVGLRLKRLNLIVSIDAEAECWRLTRSVRDATTIEIAVLALGTAVNEHARDF